MNYISRLKRMNACRDAIMWAKNYSNFQDAWNNCERGDWMLWLIGKRIKNLDERKKLVLCACKCARLSLKYVKKGEKRPLKAIQTAEKWANNDKNISLQDVINADAAAYAAAATAHTAYTAAAADAAAAAAYAAADAAYAAAADAAAYAATAHTAYTAAGAAAAYAATADAAQTKTLKKCANIVRKFYPNYKF